MFIYKIILEGYYRKIIVKCEFKNLILAGLKGRVTYLTNSEKDVSIKYANKDES